MCSYYKELCLHIFTGETYANKLMFLCFNSLIESRNFLRCQNPTPQLQTYGRKYNYIRYNYIFYIFYHRAEVEVSTPPEMSPDTKKTPEMNELETDKTSLKI